MANAFVTLNGHLLGRYWAIGQQRDIWLPECWLNFRPGANKRRRAASPSDR
jgi:hypothetical protein